MLCGDYSLSVIDVIPKVLSSRTAGRDLVFPAYWFLVSNLEHLVSPLWRPTLFYGLHPCNPPFGPCFACSKPLPAVLVNSEKESTQRKRRPAQSCLQRAQAYPRHSRSVRPLRNSLTKNVRSDILADSPEPIARSSAPSKGSQNENPGTGKPDCRRQHQCALLTCHPV